MKADITVDARYKSCPGPLLELAKAVWNSKPGQVILLLATDPGAPRDIETWAHHVKHKLLGIEREGEVFKIYVEVSG